METQKSDTIDFVQALRMMQMNNTGAHVGKVMKEGGCLMIEGVMRFFTPAPPWVFRAMAAGIHVQFGAWCRTATERMQKNIDEMMKDHQTEEGKQP